jgi:hypothetical protein
MQRYAQNMSRAVRPSDDSAYRRIVPLPPVVGSPTADELFVTSTYDFPQPEPKPKPNLRERAAVAIAKWLESLPVINDWSVGIHPLAVTNPDMLAARGVDQEALCVHGRVSGNVFRSSPIVDARLTSVGVIVRTFKGRRYRLGSPNPGFQTWCREHNLAMPTAEHRWYR